jgi:hypothetical protein
VNLAQAREVASTVRLYEKTTEEENAQNHDDCDDDDLDQTHGVYLIFSGPRAGILEAPD